LKKGREKSARNLHPWIFSGAIHAVKGDPADGDVVDVCDSREDFIAQGTYNSRSQIAVRLLTWDREEVVDHDFWRRRLKAAIDGRVSLIADPTTTAYRLVNAESDGLPGLIVDRYGDWLVLQALTAGIERYKQDIVSELNDLAQPKGVVERSDADVRTKEGLPPSIGNLGGELAPAHIEIQERGLRFQIDVHTGHKTGFYLDQRDNRALLTDYVAGSEVLNAFSYTGAFSVYAASAGAAHVVNVDTSGEALKLAESNMALNGYADRPAEYIQADVFEQLRAFRDRGTRFDAIILDPPKFAHSKGQVAAACRGYKDINLLALKLLRPDGILFTFSCSGLVSIDLFQKVVFGASADAGRQAQILHRLSQPSDHPTLLSFPEGAYLKGFVCRVW
jgi:23S rRNA (cytosine1962-C5)-methyltransferase